MRYFNTITRVRCRAGATMQRTVWGQSAGCIAGASLRLSSGSRFTCDAVAKNPPGTPATARIQIKLGITSRRPDTAPHRDGFYFLLGRP